MDIRSMTIKTAIKNEADEVNAVEAIESLADRKAWKELANLVETCIGLLPYRELEKHGVKNMVANGLGMKTHAA